MNDKPKTLQEKRDRVARFEKEVVKDDQKSIFEKMEESRKCINENEEIYSPKATPEDLKEASKAIGIVIPKEIENLYLNHTGEAPDRTVEFRLMPLWQVWDTHEMYRSMGDFSEVLNKYHLHFFWTDTESSFLGMFTDGPLIDRIALEEHDGYFSGDHSPLFRSSKSFLEQLERIDRWNRIADENEEEGREKEEAVAAFGEHFDFPYETPWDSVPFSAVTPDYPTQHHIDESDEAAYAWVKSYLEKDDFINEDEWRFIHLAFSRLAPSEDLDRVHQMLTMDDYLLPSHICQHLFHRGSKSSLEPIARCAIQGHPNCRGTAQRTLAKYIRAGKASQEEITEIYKSLGGDIAEVLRDLATLEDDLRSGLFYQW